MFFQISKLLFLLYQEHFLQFNTFCYAVQSALTVELWKQLVQFTTELLVA